MGGFGSGGKRIGAGGKAKKLADRALSGARHRTKALDADSPGEAAVFVQKPVGLTAAQAHAWDELAPFAMAAGTLTDGTRAAFVDLCEVVAMRRSMLTQLELDGLMVNAVKVDEESGERFSFGPPVAHPLLAHERQYRLREEAGKARFMLAPAGKPVTKAAEKVDPFDEFEGLSVVKGGKG